MWREMEGDKDRERGKNVKRVDKSEVYKSIIIIS